MRKAAVFALSLLGALGALFSTGCGVLPAEGSGTLTIMTAAVLPPATTGTAYGAALQAGGGVAPYSFSASSALPGGLTLANGGVLAGTPTQTGTLSFTVQVSDAAGEHSAKTFSLSVAAASGSGSNLAFTSTTLPGGTVGAAYSATVAVMGGSSPYVFAVSSGTLPAGLTLGAGGAIYGTPSVAASSTFTLAAADAKGATATQSFTLNIGAAVPPLSIATGTLPAGTTGTSYSASVVATGGTAPYTFSVSNGTAPAGLMLSAAGVLAGTPSSAGTFPFTVGVTDASGAKATQSYSVTIAVAASTLSVSTATLPGANVGDTYSATITATGGTGPYVFTVTGGTPPMGLSLTGAGVLSGSPTVANSYNFTITAADSTGATATRSYTVVIAAAGAKLAFPNTSLPNGTVGTAYTASLAATGGTAPYTYAVTSGSIPAGTSLSSSAMLTGTPTTENTYSFTLRVTDATGATATQIFSIEIDPAASQVLLLTTTAPPAAVVNQNYSYQLSVSNGNGNVTFTVPAGTTLPAGMTVSSSGLLSGTPSAVATTSFTVGFSDSSSPKNTGTGTVTFTVVNATATVTVDTTTTLATVPANFFGLHTSVYDTNLADTAALPALLANTGITTLRYPGGGYSDSYHWAQYSITPFYSTSTGACGVQQEGYLATGADFGNFARLLLAADQSGLITINYGNSVANASATVGYGIDGKHTCSEPNTAGQPQEAAAWVAYANGDPASTQLIGLDAVGFDWKTVGFWASLRAATRLATDDGYNLLRIGHAAPIGVKFWEIGNELYYNGWATNHNAESDNHAPYIYPNGYQGGSGTFNSRASLAALSPTAYGTNAVQFIQAMKAVDSTIKIGVDFSSPISTDPIPTTWNPDLAQAVCAGTNIDFAIMHYYPGTYRAVQPGELLTLPQGDIPNVAAGIRANLAQYCPANAGNIGVWLTETAPNNGLASNFPQPVIGLFTLNEFLTSLNTGIQNIDWLELHDGSYLTESEQPGPSYYGLLLAHQAAAVGDAAVKATSSANTIVSYATVKANGQKAVVLINATSTSAIAVQVTVNGATLGKSATQYSFGVSTSQSGTSLTPTPVAIPGNTFNVTVPAYTAVELLLQ